MSTSPAARTDLEILQAVRDELDWAPDVRADAVDVAVDAGAVMLSGEVLTLDERRAAARAGLRVRGVVTLADDLVVAGPPDEQVDDRAIARAVEQAFAWSSAVPASVDAAVDDRRVTITGQVEWDYQRRAARALARAVVGVREVVDRTELTPRLSAPDTAERIHAALVRRAALDAQDIEVAVDGTTVTLTGRVHSALERREAVHAAWGSPHVERVVDLLTIAP
ncbi:BON domain-containing protein [Pseudolysinimonas sp.]|uniref:BON domain-containing protein n=1 Tax=Pseudolysinimonas sp. TaxID=2680009 RepID=UPI003F80C8A0